MVSIRVNIDFDHNIDTAAQPGARPNDAVEVMPEPNRPLHFLNR
jgi:hypothetical protein